MKDIITFCKRNTISLYDTLEYISVSMYDQYLSIPCCYMYCMFKRFYLWNMQKQFLPLNIILNLVC